MNNRHPWQLKKSKSWFWSYQLNSTADLATLAQFLGKWAGLAVLLAGSSKTAPRIFIFSIVLGAKYLSYVKFITTYAVTFLGYIISVLASVYFELGLVT